MAAKVISELKSVSRVKICQESGHMQCYITVSNLRPPENIKTANWPPRVLLFLRFNCTVSISILWNASLVEPTVNGFNC